MATQDYKSVFIFGYSGHAYVIIETMLDLGYSILGYFDKQEAISNPYNLKYLGFELDVNLKSIVKNNYVFPTVGGADIRKKLISIFISENLNQFSLIDRAADVSKSAKIGKSTYVGKSTNINALSKIGIGVIINTNAVVEHECEIGDFTHLAPSATLLGNVIIGANTFVGANAVIKQNIEVGSNCILGAGSVLLNNLPNGEIWAGNPAKILK